MKVCGYEPIIAVNKFPAPRLWIRKKKLEAYGYYDVVDLIENLTPSASTLLGGDIAFAFLVRSCVLQKEIVFRTEIPEPNAIIISVYAWV